MPHLDKDLIGKIIDDINNQQEKSRRAYALRRHRIFRDGGRQFLIEELRREFGENSIKEFRLCPINLLKKMVGKKSQIYKTPPIRRAFTELDTDQSLIDFYTEELALDKQMGKANTYYNLHSNTALYVFPALDRLKLSITPPHLYSIIPDRFDRSIVRVWAFNNFTEEHEVATDQDLPSATGFESFARDRTSQASSNKVASQERRMGEKRRYILWTDEAHVTVTGKGEIVTLDPAKGDEQFINPIERSPVVHLQKDTDGDHAWATQGEDAVDIALVIQRMWTDLATVIKHQGFGQMVITSEEMPSKQTIGVNKVLWLKRFEGKEPPTVEFLTADSRISEIKEAIRDLLFLLLSTNDINPSAVGKPDGGSAFTSGIQALLEMSDALEAMKCDQPVLRDAEKELWEIIKRWHNWMFDTGILNDEAKKMGKFSDEFGVQIAFAEIKPVETAKDRLDFVDQARGLRIMTKKDALKKLNPDMTDSEIDLKLQELDEEITAQREKFGLPPNTDRDSGGDEDAQEEEA